MLLMFLRFGQILFVLLCLVFVSSFICVGLTVFAVCCVLYRCMYNCVKSCIINEMEFVFTLLSRATKVGDVMMNLKTSLRVLSSGSTVPLSFLILI